MNDREADQHLTPEICIDLLDGAPVEACHRLHASRCDTCRRGIDELTDTLTLLRSAEEREVTGVTGREEIGSRGKGFGVWLVAAAAFLVALVLIYPTVRPDGWSDGRPEAWMSERDASVTEPEGLLLPVERDEAFQLLLVLSDEVAGSEAMGFEREETDAVFSAIDELTPEERGFVLEQLTEEMRSIS
jgi:hypothetical protein